MIEIPITQIIAFFLLGFQLACLVAQIVTQDLRWMLGAVGLMPFVIILAYAHKIIGG